jgi:hypothetical protein
MAHLSFENSSQMVSLTSPPPPTLALIVYNRILADSQHLNLKTKTMIKDWKVRNIKNKNQDNPVPNWRTWTELQCFPSNNERNNLRETQRPNSSLLQPPFRRPDSSPNETPLEFPKRSPRSIHDTCMETCEYINSRRITECRITDFIDFTCVDQFINLSSWYLATSVQTSGVVSSRHGT